MADRHCLMIPFLVGTDAVIGNSCANNPAWDVPCDPADLQDQACLPASLLEDFTVSYSFAVDADATATLLEPGQVTVPFT